MTLRLLPVGSRGNSALVYRGNTIRPGERRFPIRRWNVCAAAHQDGDRIRQDRRHGLGCRVASPQQCRKPEWHTIVQECPDRCSWPYDAEPPRRSGAIPPRERLRGIPRCSANPARRTASRERQKPIVLCLGKPESRGLFRPFDQFSGVGGPILVSNPADPPKSLRHAHDHADQGRWQWTGDVGLRIVSDGSERYRPD